MSSLPVVCHSNSRIQFTVLALGVTFLTILYGLNVSAAEEKKEKPQHVIIAPVMQSEIADRIEALGTARARESVQITSNVTEKIRKIHFEDGQLVETGDLLVVLEQSEEQANFEQAKAVLADRKQTLERLQKLEKQKLTSTEELDRARLDAEQAQANIIAIQAQINDRIIRAPFPGVLGLRQVSVGHLVETGDIITTLDDISSIKLDFTVSAVYLPYLHKGLVIETRATALGNTVYKGEVKTIESRIDPETRSVTVRAILPNEDRRIVPGLLMQVNVLRNPRSALLIPEAALLPQGNKQFVMLVVNKDKRETVEKRQVTIGTRIPGKVEILGGLNLGDRIVTHGNSRAKPGGEIKILAIDDGNIDIPAILKKSAGKADDKNKNKNAEKPGENS